jgi:hypothetical protein
MKKEVLNAPKWPAHALTTKIKIIIKFFIFLQFIYNALILKWHS